MINVNKMMADTMPLDKQLHMLWLFFLTTFLLVFVPLSLAVAAMFTLAVVKEVLDGSKNTMPEHFKDIVAGMMGVGLAVLVSML